MKALLIAIAITLACPATPAAAWPCPHGQLYRVHLHLCVGLHSALARPYVDHRRFVAVYPGKTVREVSENDDDHSWYVEFVFPQTIKVEDGLSDEEREARDKLRELRGLQ